jgi:hypothetical protein
LLAYVELERAGSGGVENRFCKLQEVKLETSKPLVLISRLAQSKRLTNNGL